MGKEMKWSETHHVFGHLISFGALLQVLGGLVRPHPKDKATGHVSPFRRPWELQHKFVGRTAAIGAAVNIILGMALINKHNLENGVVTLCAILLAIGIVVVAGAAL